MLINILYINKIFKINNNINVKDSNIERPNKTYLK